MAGPYPVTWLLAIVMLLVQGAYLAVAEPGAWLVWAFTVAATLVIAGAVRSWQTSVADPRFTSRPWLLSTLVAVLGLMAAASFLPWAMYNRWGLPGGGRWPLVVRPDALSVLLIIAAALLMAMVWSAFAVLRWYRRAPTRHDGLGAFVTVGGLWTLMFGGFVTRMDRTSSDILLFTLPIGLVLVVAGIAALALRPRARVAA